MSGKQNRETVRRWVEVMWNRRPRRDQVITPAFTEHAPRLRLSAGHGRLAPTTRVTMDWLLGQFRDLTMTIESALADDTVAIRVDTTGTNLGR